MENASWVSQKIAYLDPPENWQPDPAPALARVLARQSPARIWPVWTIAAVLALASLLLLPSTRGIAQQLWQLLAVRRVGFVRVNPWPAGVPSPQVNLIGTPIPIPAHDINEVQRRVGYQPRLPIPGVLSGTPQLYTTFSVSAGTVVRVADLHRALAIAGVTGQTVPPEWDGARLALHTSAVVLAQWPDLALAQSLPLTVSAPVNFDFPGFSTLILRVLGVAPDEAARLARQMGTAPPWLAPVSRDLDATATFEVVTLNSGPATLLQQSGNRITLTWTVPDRVYVLTGIATRELVIAAANALQ